MRLDACACYASQPPPAMGWLWLVGSIKLYVSFSEYSLFYRSLFQKRPIILSILLTEATHIALSRLFHCLSATIREAPSG